MIYSLAGKVMAKHGGFFVLETGGVGYKIFANDRTLGAMPGAGESVRVFTHLAPRENAMDLYGFLDEPELRFFELLILVSGVGPRSALSILDVAGLRELSAAIKEGRPDTLTRASGIGRKTAERVIVELRNKVIAEHSEQTIKAMETNADLLETLVELGYRREEARSALARVPEDAHSIEVRLKAALKMLSRSGKV